MSSVTIIGAGIAGLSAALRLVERGFQVTVLEQNDFAGGKLGAHRHGRHHADYHEHAYHMYLNWYHNFWQIMEEIGIRDRFRPQPEATYIHRDQPNQLVRYRNAGSPDEFLPNILSGLASPLDMFVYGYSLADLLGTPFPPGEHLDRISVLGFFRNRPYMTDAARGLHQQTLAKAFACPTYLSDSVTYRHFVGYGFRQPSPMVWLLKGNTQQTMMRPLLNHLEAVAGHNRSAGGAGSFEIRYLRRADRLSLQGGRVVGISISELPRSPTVEGGQHVPARGTEEMAIAGDVIVAVPPQALSRLIDPALFTAAPSLANVRKLQSQPMAALDIYFRRKLPNVPDGITILLGSRHALTFLDLSQLWPRDPETPDVTFLNLVMSDFSVFVPETGLPDQEQVLAFALAELAQYLPFDLADIDRGRCHLQTNVAEPLFTNQVGSWAFRPGTVCAVPNLFLAGDYCRTVVDVVTIEGAVISGLMAAEAVRQRARQGAPVAIRVPDVYPQPLLTAAKFMGLPAAYGAKALATAQQTMHALYRETFPND